MLLTALLSAAGAVSAAAESNDSISDSDYGTLKTAITPYVYSLTKQTHLYNWHNRGEDKGLSSDPKDSASYAAFQNITQRYWEKQNEKSSSYYGEGLYAATDPVETRIYGATYKGNRSSAFEDFWVLTEMKVPAGFRFFDLGKDGQRKFPVSMPEGFFQKIGCPANWDRGFQLYLMLSPNQYSGHPKCAGIIRRLLKDDLKVDGIAFGYGVTRFSQCDSLNGADAERIGNKETAFVIFSGNKLGPGDVSIYNKKSTGSEAERLRIQSMFMSEYLRAHPKQKDKSTVSLAPLIGWHRLWKDMDGQKMPADLKEWMRQNLYHCETSLRYENAFPEKGEKPSASAPMSREEGSGLDAPAGSAW